MMYNHEDPIGKEAQIYVSLENGDEIPEEAKEETMKTDKEKSFTFG